MRRVRLFACARTHQKVWSSSTIACGVLRTTTPDAVKIGWTQTTCACSPGDNGRTVRDQTICPEAGTIPTGTVVGGALGLPGMRAPFSSAPVVNPLSSPTSNCTTLERQERVKTGRRSRAARWFVCRSRIEEDPDDHSLKGE